MDIFLKKLILSLMVAIPILLAIGKIAEPLLLGTGGIGLGEWGTIIFLLIILFSLLGLINT